MDRNQKQQYTVEKEEEGGAQSSRMQESQLGEEAEAVAPGVEVVRSNTPRPLSADALVSASGYWRLVQASEPALTFPTQAPVAPPLPEELGDEAVLAPTAPTTPAPVAAPAAAAETQDFIWLFEYGLEMDPLLLNSAERLDGQALIYGPAVLKGYALMLGARHEEGIDGRGRAIFAIVPGVEPESEVWGVLYRIPRRLSEMQGEIAARLDIVHSAVPPHNLFHRIDVLVLEGYREQSVPCLTYIAAAQTDHEFRLVPVRQWDGDSQFVQQLVEVARKQKLPDRYINQALLAPAVAKTPVAQLPETRLPSAPPHMQAIATFQIPPSTLPPSAVSGLSEPSELARDESGQERGHIEPELIAQASSLLLQGDLSHGSRAQRRTPDPQSEQALKDSAGGEDTERAQKTISVVKTPRRLVVFALYLVTFQVAVLSFAIAQGLGWGQNVLTESFTPLGVPWLVIVYGLLGGCLSSTVTLARLRKTNLPLFVVVAWFARPFIGATLALFAFVLLTSGIFVFGSYFEHHLAFFWLAGGLAGLCEGWIFFRNA